MLTLDGREGEGGGQLLRVALALSAITQTPMSIHQVRGGRARPGLLRQHLTAVRAVAAACGARVTGDRLGSTELTFEPGPIEAGDHELAIGTAGSTGLVLQALLPVLWHAPGPSTVTVTGGTHNLAAPPADFLRRALFPILVSMGFPVQFRHEAHGFFPAGGGKVHVEVEPATPAPLDLQERGEISRVEAVALLSNLPARIADRELDVVREGLGLTDRDTVEIRSVPSPGPGNALVVSVVSPALTEVFTGFGRRGVPAEEIAAQVVDDVQTYLRSGVPVGPHLADQLLLPLAIAGGRFVTGPLTLHSRTAISIIERFGLQGPAIHAQSDQSHLVACSI